MATTAAASEFDVWLKEPHLQQERFIRSRAKRKIVRAGRRGGKTTGIAIFAVERFLDGRRVLYAAPTADQIARFWVEVTLALEELINAGVFRKNQTLHIIEKPRTEQRIRAKTAWNADTLRGDYADVLILDEWQLMNEEAWEVVGAPMLMDNGGDAVFIYTPPSFHSKSVTKAADPKHASKMYKAAQEEMAAAARDGRKSRWEAFHFTSLDNPHLSQEGLDEASRDMTQLAYRQEILAEDIDEIPGALWKRATIEKGRVAAAPEKLIRIVVGVDPPGGSTECGIVAAGKAMCSCKGTPEMHAFVLEDASLKAPPDVWATTAVGVYKRRLADCLLGERNFGGDMVKSTIQTADKTVHFKEAHASRGKAVRAEPIAALYEQGKVHHVGSFGLLEDEQCGWVPGMSTESPNRLDANVWALTDLMIGPDVKFY